MRSKLFSLWLVLAVAFVLPALAEQYKGKVGQVDVSVSLNYRPDGSVAGTCRYPSRPGVVYVLKGERRDNGQRLILREFEGDRPVSTMTLNLAINAGRARWAGTTLMADGRRVEVWFGE